MGISTRSRTGRSGPRRGREQEIAELPSMWWFEPAFIVGAAIVVVGVSLVMPASVRPYWVGAALATAVGALAYVIIRFKVSASTATRTDVEVWTAQELRRLERRSAWHAFNALEFNYVDVDHVVVGPHGVFALETKRTSGDWLEDTSYRRRALDEAVQQARRAATKVRSLLVSVDEPGPVDVAVTPVVVLWGDMGDRPIDEQHLVRDGVTVVGGRLLRARLESWEGEPLTAYDGVRAIAKLERFVSTRDPRRDGAK